MHTGIARRAPARLLVVVACIAAGVPLGSRAHAADPVVTGLGQMNGWSAAETGPGADGEFVHGPATPPFGDGSFHQVITNSTHASKLMTSALNGTALGAVGDISYWTYVHDDLDRAQATYLVLYVDLDGNGTSDDALVFEPAYQNGGYAGEPVPDQCDDPGNRCIVLDTWQDWEADTGGWWADSAGTFGPPMITLSSYLAANPTATVATDRPAFVVQAGVGQAWIDFDGSVDGVTVDGVTYDFELIEFGVLTHVKCDETVDDITAVQTAVDLVPDGATIELFGTCDFAPAAPHGGDNFSNPNAAVVVGAADAVDGITITSGAPGGTAVGGDGDETAFYVAPTATNVTIRDLTFRGIGRAVAAHDTDGTVVRGNLIGAGRDLGQAILGLSTPPGTVTYGPDADEDGTGDLAVTPSTTAGLTAFTVDHNVVAFGGAALPITTDRIGVDVRQQGRVAVGITIGHNAISLGSGEFPLYGMRGISLTSRDDLPNIAHPIRNVTISDNTVGDAICSTWGGRAGITLHAVRNFTVAGNRVCARLTPTFIPNPGGGIIVHDSADGNVTGNTVREVADPSTSDGDLGGIAVADDLYGAFGYGSGLPTARITVTGNTVGGAGSTGLMPRRGIVVTGADAIVATANDVDVTDKGLNIGVAIQGPGNLANPGLTTVPPQRVTNSTLCTNSLNDITDNPVQVRYNRSSNSTNNQFPTGSAYPGNVNC